MSGYERVALTDTDDHIQGGDSPTTTAHHNTSYDDHAIPNSPPPSFRSRASSPTNHRHVQDNDPLSTDADRTLADAFDSPSDDEDDNDDDEFEDASEDARDRRRLISGGNISTNPQDVRRREEGDRERERTVERRPIALPDFQPTATNFRIFGGGNGNDGVFANMTAKPERGEQEDEKPPSYEAAAADATPPYWETTILAPGMMSDEVYVDGLPVGSVFSFLWNAMISVAFTFVGFLLTYLLHTTHAAKNGSRAGLGFTLVQYGYTMRGGSSNSGAVTPDPSTGFLDSVPTDPNGHDFDPSAVVGDPVVGDPTVGGFTSSDWFAYTLMIVGWFILIRSVSDFYRARRHEMLVLQSPDRGLGVAVVAEGEAPESSV